MRFKVDNAEEVLAQFRVTEMMVRSTVADIKRMVEESLKDIHRTMESTNLLLKRWLECREVIAQEIEGIKPVYIDQLELSKRTINACNWVNIRTLRDLWEAGPSGIHQITNLGKKSMREIVKAMENNGISVEEWYRYHGLCPPIKEKVADGMDA